MKHFLFFLLLLVSAYIPVCAQSLRLPVTFSDHMVLQRNRPLTFTGEAPAQKRVKLTLNSKIFTTVSDDKGRFVFQLPAFAAGGPYTMELVCENERKTFHDVYIGEVWLCSGQSNMQFALEDCSTATEDLAAADTLDRIHLYNIGAAFIPFREIWGKERIETVDRGGYISFGSWQKCSAATARRFSAIGFHVGRILAQRLGCHIGLIANALDGCTTEGWIDRRTLEDNVPEILQGHWTDNTNIMSWSRRRARYNLQQTDIGQHRHPYEPTYLYDAAIRPLEAYPLRGVLWYQGESNAELVDMHCRLFTALERSWRQTWNDPQLPFYTVQIASLDSRPTWPAFRDSQRRLADSLQYTYMTVSHDMGEADNIHPTRKRTIGERLAASVLHHSYDFDRVTPCGPSPQRAFVSGPHELCIVFDQAEGLHFGAGSGAADFEVGGADGYFTACTSYRTEGNRLLLTFSSQISAPQRVRFAYRDCSVAQLLNAASLPCSTFMLDIEP